MPRLIFHVESRPASAGRLDQLSAQNRPDRFDYWHGPIFGGCAAVFLAGAWLLFRPDALNFWAAASALLLMIAPVAVAGFLADRHKARTERRQELREATEQQLVELASWFETDTPPAVQTYLDQVNSMGRRLCQGEIAALINYCAAYGLRQVSAAKAAEARAKIYGQS